MLAANDNQKEGDGGRTCTKCKTWKQFGQFNKRANGKYGVYNACRDCQKLENAASYAKDGPAKRAVATRAWRAANPEKKKAHDAAYRARNPDRVKESAKNFLENPTPGYAVRRRETRAVWRAANPEIVKAKARRQYEKLKSDPSHRVNSAVSRAIRASLPRGEKARRKTFDLLGYSKQDLMAHLERQFLPGMSWENYGIDGWHIDHIIPKSIFNITSVEDLDFKRAWALSNLQPLWAKDNQIKHATYKQPFQPSLAFGKPANDIDNDRKAA